MKGLHVSHIHAVNRLFLFAFPSFPLLCMYVCMYILLNSETQKFEVVQLEPLNIPEDQGASEK